jgi:hypothetical protein
LAHDQPPAPLVQLPDWRKFGLGARLAVGFAIDTWTTGALAGTVVVVALGATVVVVVALGATVVVVVALGATVVVVVGVAVVGVGTVVVGSDADVGVRTVVVVRLDAEVGVALVCAVNLAACFLAVGIVASLFVTCATVLTTCLVFMVVVVTIEVVTTVVVVPDARTVLGCTVAIGPANAINSTALSDRAIVPATTRWARMTAAPKRRSADSETSE